ncbi:nucleoside-diphosphate-sugar epimerase [Cladorrhinum samala]|uniref:Nucleoside-diphosphate-sugar epimerase n=1 Tax=Cladorrhinum samala TaxID=585594 RepID=A0AAV9HXN8_9PEZI|nr:nucleoside-diphosphate-sugar epimerase [Cladorrhinum samala]
MSSSTSRKNILITGAAGLVGPLLASHLLTLSPDYHLILTDLQAPTLPAGTDLSRITIAQGDLTSPDFLSTLLGQSSPLHAVYILHGIMSSTSEANYQLSLSINVHSILTLTDRLVKSHRGAKLIFSSSQAVFGNLADPDRKVTDDTLPRPESTYGAHKLMMETHLAELHRKGYLDVVVARLPTISVRPGKPTGAASSWLSGIIREPMAGQECVVPLEDRGFRSYLSSPRTVIENLGRVLQWESRRELGGGGGGSRVIQFPGVSVSVQELLDALKKFGGEDKLALVKEVRDEGLEKILRSWPRDFDVARSLELGLVGDDGVDAIVGDYVEALKTAPKA